MLHDMGEGLKAPFGEGDAKASEWRTAPLWGIGLTKSVNASAGFLHDGRARSLEEAILWHGGEAEASRKAFEKLSSREKEALMAFLEAL